MPNETARGSREMEERAAAARQRFEQATLDMASERRFGGTHANSSEIDMMEEATRLVKEALRPD